MPVLRFRKSGPRPEFPKPKYRHRIPNPPTESTESTESESIFILDPDEAALVNRNINHFIRAYNRKSDVIEGVPPAIVSKLARRCTSACAVADLDQEIERLRDFASAGLTEIALRIYEDPAATIRLLGERVVPALAAA